MALVNRSTRLVGKCKVCKVPVVKVTADTFGYKMSAACPVCDRVVIVQRVLGSHSTKKCDTRCLNATGPNCDCSCGGFNHGAGH